MPAAEAASSTFQKGMALGLYSKDPNYSYEQDLKEMKELGVDHVSLVVSWYQRDVYATNIYPHYVPRGDFDTTTDPKLIEVIQQAHKLGLKVFLFPILRIEHRKEKEWRGNIKPLEINTWWQNYRQFMLHYARIAAKENVELFSVGSELCSLEEKVDLWKKLIRDIRGFYRGEILYSANWDHYQKILFWDDLDYVGLNGYFEVATHDNPTLQEVKLAWWDIENDINNWLEQNKKKLIFTEIGYPNMTGGCQKPWDYTRPAPPDMDEQALCYEAFLMSWLKNTRLYGVYFWNWYGPGGPDDTSYTPRGKKASEVLKRWYTKRPQTKSS